MTNIIQPAPQNDTDSLPKAAPTPASTESLIDFDSDVPLAVCGLRNNGDEVCEVCQ